MGAQWLCKPRVGVRSPVGPPTKECYMNAKDTLDKAYGNIPKEPVSFIEFDFPVFRGIRYYWLRLVRFITR